MRQHYSQNSHISQRSEAQQKWRFKRLSN